VARRLHGRLYLTQYAPDGFQGQSGVMPPKGGNPALCDDQVKAAVRWMASQVR